MSAILELRNLAKHYPGQRAVDGITLSVEAGSFFSLLGPSGCGKTTTLRLIAGFEEPTAGDVLLKGQNVNGRKPYERNVSTVFQSYALFPHLTARENIEFGLKRRRAQEIVRRVSEVLSLVSLQGKEARRPAQLSGGERQRVAIARALAGEPSLILADEPTGNLDSARSREIVHLLHSIAHERSVRVLLVTHDREAAAIADRCCTLRDGKLTDGAETSPGDAPDPVDVSVQSAPAQA